MGGTWTICTGERGRRGQRKDANPNNNKKRLLKSGMGYFVLFSLKEEGDMGDSRLEICGENRLLFLFFFLNWEGREDDLSWSNRTEENTPIAPGLTGNLCL